MGVSAAARPDGFKLCPHCQSLIPEAAMVCRRCTRDLKPARAWRDPKSYLAVATGAAGFFSALGVIWLYANLVQPFAGPVVWIKDARCWHDKATFTIVNTGSRGAIIDSLSMDRQISRPNSRGERRVKVVPLMPALSVEPKSVLLFHVDLEERKDIDGSVIGGFAERYRGSAGESCSQNISLSSITVPQGIDSVWDARIFRKRERNIEPKIEPLVWGPEACTCMREAEAPAADPDIGEDDPA